MLARWKKLSSKLVQRNPWWTYMVDAFQIPNGVTGEYHYVHTDGSAMIVPVLPDGRLVLVNQYRYLCDRESVEFPCGGVKTGHSYDEMARLELEEETGYHAEQWTAAGEFNPFNGATDEICRVYVARVLTFTAARPEATEEFETLRLTPLEIEAMIAEERIWDGMTLAAWALVRGKFINSRTMGRL